MGYNIYEKRFLCSKGESQIMCVKVYLTEYKTFDTYPDGCSWRFKNGYLQILDKGKVVAEYVPGNITLVKRTQ